MGAPKTKDVGGGTAAPLANSFNDFLLQGLTSGSFGNSRTPEQLANNAAVDRATKMSQAGGMFGNIGQKALAKLPQPTGMGPNPQEGQNQTNMFGDTINNMLQGKIGDPSSYQGMFEGLQGNNGGLPNLAGVSYNTPQFQNAPGFQGMDLGQYMKQLGAGGAGGGFDALGAYNQSLQGLGSLNIPKDFNLSQGLPTNFDTPETKAIQDIIGRNQDKNVQDLRARFGAGGGTAYGTGASFAEGNLRAESAPLIAQALSQVNRQERELDMNNRNMVGNLLLGQRGQDSANLQAGGQIGLGQRGQDMSSASQGQGNQLGLIGLMLQQQLAGNQYGMNSPDMQNQFNLANSGQQMNADQFNTNASLQNQQMMNQFGLGKGQIGLGMQGNQANQQQNMMNQLFGSFNNSNNLGTSQRQTVSSPSMGSQIFNGAMGIGQMAGGLMTGNPFAVMGGAGQLGGSFGGMGGSTPFMSGNQGLFSGAGGNLGMGNRQQQSINPTSLLSGQNLGMQTGGPNMQGNFGGMQLPNMMNGQAQQGVTGGFNPQMLQQLMASFGGR